MANASAILKSILVPLETPADSKGRLPADELRFVLEYDRAPDRDEQRARIAKLLGSDAFQLESLAETAELANFLVLRFPQIERTLPQPLLYEIGYEFADALDLVSAEPDIGAKVFADPEPLPPGRATESADVIGPLCWVDKPPPADRQWALKNARISDAWALSRGAGIMIGQPDTGVARHDEIEAGMLNLNLATDILGGDSDPTDPLQSGTANPGHGTGTASVAASRATGQITGAAPAAELVPIRCVKDVKIFDCAPVAAAIAHATAVGCHVISMSLGGIPSRAVHAAVRAAVARDIIVIAAAGNCVRTVVWPARYDAVIAVAGSNVADKPWKGSSRGDAVDITAPGEHVWRALRTATADSVSGIDAGQGTSFATALVAGAAALWLSHHGRGAAIAEAHRRGIPLQRLFRSALQASARTPAGWDTDDFGPGILDAAALLALALEAIPAGAQESAVAAASSADLLDESFGPALRDAGFPWARYEAEIGAIALGHARLGAPIASLSAESKVAQTQPSTRLSAAAAQSSDVRLRSFSLSDGASLMRPPSREIGPRDAEMPTLLVAPKAIRFESRAPPTPEAVRKHLANKGKTENLERLNRHLAERRAEGADLSGSDILGSAEVAIDDMVAGRVVRPEGRFGLEALVRLTGRPALRVRNNSVRHDDLQAGVWGDQLLLAMTGGVLQQRIARIGRIDMAGEHVGTGYVAGKGVLLTNRHVIQAFAAPVPRRNGPDKWVMLSDQVTIDFADTPSSATAASRFKIKGVIGAGSDDIDPDRIEFSDLDAATLEVETENQQGTKLPTALDLMRDPSLADAKRDILVIGYPARPAVLPRDAAGDINMEVVKRLSELFGTDYGNKYLAPGEIIVAVGKHPEDTESHMFCHDATTLGGNSGSCILSFNELAAIGLHFGGDWLKQNFAHGLGVLSGRDPFLADGGLNWK